VREAGARGFTLREVARRSGVSHTAPYRHFHDKQDLLAAIAEEGFQMLAKQMERAGKSDGHSADRLIEAGRAYVAFALRHPDHFQVMFETDLDPARHPSARAAAQRAFGGLLALVRDCQEEGKLPGGPRIRVARDRKTDRRPIACGALRPRGASDVGSRCRTYRVCPACSLLK
jgi:AcrR family transcriptional regulator